MSNGRAIIDRAHCLEYALRALASPPTKPHIERVEPVGKLVWQCVVPAELCVGHANSRVHWSVHLRHKRNLLSTMLAQHQMRPRSEVLPGRPQVLLVRFTSTRPDRGNGWEKLPVDCLLTPKSVMTATGIQQRKGLGFFDDDSELHIDSRCWWEAGPRGAGFVFIRVFDGERGTQ